jgi:hypothetical protein
VPWGLYIKIGIGYTIGEYSGKPNRKIKKLMSIVRPWFFSKTKKSYAN